MKEYIQSRLKNAGPWKSTCSIMQPLIPSKSMIAIIRPFGEIVSSPFEIHHTSPEINELIKQLNSLDGDTKIVMEHAGRYYEPMAYWLSNAGLFVSAVNPKLIKDFNNNSLRKVKTDKADAVKIARYALDNWTEFIE